MSDFNAGSIEGTMGLDNTPFKAGLAESRRLAAQVDGRRYQAKLGLDSSEATAKQAVADAALDDFDHKVATAKADLDISRVLAKNAILAKVLDAGGLGKGVTTFGLMTGKVFALTGGILGLISIMGPLTGVVGGLGAAGIAAFGGMAVSMALFSGAVKSAFSVITEANKAGVTLTGWAGLAQRSLKGLTDAWSSLMHTVQPAIFKDMAIAFNVVADIIPRLAPLLLAMAQGVGLIIGQIDILTHSALFADFLQELTAFMHGFLVGAAPVIANVLAGFMHIFIALEPLMAIVGHGIQVAASAFEQFAERLDNGGIKPFIAYMAQWLPIVAHLFVSVFSGVRNLLAGLTPLAGPAITFLEALVTAIGNLHLGPLARGFGDIFTALTPLLPVLSHLVNAVLGPLGHLLSGIAQDAIVPLADSLNSRANPAIHALHNILHDLVKPLSLFIGSIANLVNPTGVALLGTLLQGLEGIVSTLAPPFSALAVALESLIDDALNAIMPILPGFLSALGGVAGVLAWVAGGMAAILAHKAVVDTLLAMYGAFKALTIISTIVSMVTAVVGAFEAFTAIAAAEGIMAGIAAVSPALAGGISLIGAAIDFALGPVGLVIIGLTALAAGLIYAYKHSETFRNIVNGAFSAVKRIAGDVLHWLSGAIKSTVDFVKSHWELLLVILTGPIGIAIAILTGHFGDLKNQFFSLVHTVLQIVGDGVDAVVKFFISLPGRILSANVAMLRAGATLMGKVFDGLKSVGSDILNWASQLPGKILDFFKNLGSDLKHRVGSAVGQALNPFHIPVPHLAAGGVATGPTVAVVGDNPTSEAIIPLDKYDIPRKGDVSAIAARSQAANDRMVVLLATLVAHLTGQKQMDPEEFAAAFGRVQEGLLRKQVQMVRAAA